MVERILVLGLEMTKSVSTWLIRISNDKRPEVGRKCMRQWEYLDVAVGARDKVCGGKVHRTNGSLHTSRHVSRS